ncbi:MAG: DMT family transporter [Alphaproteobacteria bacterium]
MYINFPMISQLTTNQKGMLLGLGGYTAFAFSDTAVKYIAPHYPALQVMSIQTSLAGILLILCSHFLGGWQGWNTRRELPIHIMRAVMNVGCSLLVFTSFIMLSLANVYAMIFAKPFFAALIAIFIYKEYVSAKRWGAIIIGFLGVLVILQPSATSLKVELLLPLTAAVFIALMFVSARSLKSCSPFILAFYPMFGTFLFTLPFVLFFGMPDFRIFITTGELEFVSFKPIPLEHAPFFFLIALLSGTGILCVSLAFRIAQAATVAPFLYTEMIWGILFGYLIFSDIPDIWMLFGTAIIISSGLYLIFNEGQRLKAPMPDNV